MVVELCVAHDCEPELVSGVLLDNTTQRERQEKKGTLNKHKHGIYAQTWSFSHTRYKPLSKL